MKFTKTILLLSFIPLLYLQVCAVNICHFSIPIQQQQNCYIIPFTLNDGLMIVSARINDSLGNFIIDTGAEGLVLNSKYFEGWRDDTRDFYGVSGQGNGLITRKENNIIVDALYFKDISADVIDLSAIENQKNIKIAGLIGYNLLKDFEIMFNYRSRFVALSKVDDNGEVIDPMPFIKNIKDSLSFTLGNFIPIIEVSIDGVKKKFGIDTGAEINLLDLKRSKDIIAQFQPIRTIRLSGADSKENDVLAGRLYKVVILEKYRCATMATVLMNMRNLNKIYRSNLDGILGFEFLSPWLFSINYKKQKLYLHELKLINP